MNPAELAVNATRLHACFEYIPEQWSLVNIPGPPDRTYRPGPDGRASEIAGHRFANPARQRFN
jgi:hypothetical protein